MSLDDRTRAFDQAVADRFADYELSPAPEDWTLIAAQLPPVPTRRRRPVGWWMLGLAAALLGIMALAHAWALEGQDAGERQRLAALVLELPTGRISSTPSPSATAVERQASTRPDGISHGQGARAGVDDGSPLAAAVDSEAKALSPALGAREAARVSEVRYAALAALPLDPFALGAPSLSGRRGPLACPSFAEGGRFRFALRAHAGPVDDRRRYGAASGNLVNYLTEREQSEEQLTGAVAGLRLELVGRRGLLLRAGVDAHLYRWRTRFPGPIETRTVEVEVVDPASGEVLRTDSYTEIFRRDQIRYSRVHTVSLPLGVGYRFEGERVSPYALVEAGYELTVARRGTFFQPGGEEEGITRESRLVARYPGLRYGATLGVDFQLRPKLSLGMAARVERVGSLGGSRDLLADRRSAATGLLTARYDLLNLRL